MIRTWSHMQVLQIHEDLFWLSWLAYNILQHLTPSYCELPIICTHRPAFKCQATQVASSWVAGPLCLAAQREGGEVLVTLHGLLRQHSTRREMGIDETLTSIRLKKYSETKTYSSETKSILWKPRIIRKPNSKGLLRKPRILRKPKSLHSKPKHVGGGFLISCQVYESYILDIEALALTFAQLQPIPPRRDLKFFRGQVSQGIAVLSAACVLVCPLKGLEMHKI